MPEQTLRNPIMERIKLARNVMDSYTIRVEHLPGLAKKVLDSPAMSEEDLSDWFDEQISTYFASRRELRAIIRAVRYDPK